MHTVVLHLFHQELQFSYEVHKFEVGPYNEVDLKVYTVTPQDSLTKQIVGTAFTILHEYNNPAKMPFYSIVNGADDAERLVKESIVRSIIAYNVPV